MQGIPSFGSFLAAASNKTVTAKDLVAAAIAANQLTPDTQNDIGYLNAIDLQNQLDRIYDWFESYIYRSAIMPLLESTSNSS